MGFPKDLYPEDQTRWTLMQTRIAQLEAAVAVEKKRADEAPKRHLREQEKNMHYMARCFLHQLEISKTFLISRMTLQMSL